MRAFEKTVARSGGLEGIGIHSGKISKMDARPLGAGSGIQFYRQGRRVEGWVRENRRCTALGTPGRDEILTVEHLLAACAGLGVCNLRVDVEGPEIPALDSSAAPFVRFFKNLGIEEQSKPRDFFKPAEPIFCYDNTSALVVYPAERFSVAYVLDYDHPQLRNQPVHFEITQETFEREIAPARTFCTEDEAKVLRQQGFGLGASFDNVVVMADMGCVNGTLRFPDECARHKVLDLVGDLALLGVALLGRVVGIRSGHYLNRMLVQKILSEKEKV